MLRYLLLTGLLLPALAAQAAQPLTYTVADQKALPRDNFVQGLEVDGNTLLLSSGGYGESRLRRYALDSGALLAEYELPKQWFAEGVTRWEDYLYQLTWRARRLLVYRADTLQPVRSLSLPGEGWGITHSDTHLIYSDGSHRLHFISPESERILHSVAVTMNNKPVTRLNELEWIAGRIWANVWLTDRIVIIDPDSGNVEYYLDMKGLLPATERQRNTDVLNGIAYDNRNGNIWVTGKRWPWMYRIIPAFPHSPDTPNPR
jgi:glutamine cyclotransferase